MLSLRDAPKVLAKGLLDGNLERRRQLVVDADARDIVNLAAAVTHLSRHGRPPVTGSYGQICDDEALRWNSDAARSLWVAITHQYIREVIEREHKKMDEEHDDPKRKGVYSFNKNRQKLVYYARAAERTARSSTEALADAHHLRQVQSVISQASSAHRSPFYPPIKDDVLFGTCCG
ncbi:hypothetical protein JCM3770_000182 [Rhodotorula araucariae]